MSELLESRAAILAALVQAGVRTATTGQMAAPCVRIEPGDPWSEPVRLPGRLLRWQLWAIAGRADSEGALATLADLLELVDTALRTVDGAQLPTWGKPSDYLIEGVPYAASSATVTYARR